MKTKLPLFRHRDGERFRAHNAGCASAFRLDRRLGLFYGAVRTANGVVEWEEYSVQANLCAYCGIVDPKATGVKYVKVAGDEDPFDPRWRI